jgi:hypothetical protein
MQFNLNDKVKVKLTEAGREMYREFFTEAVAPMVPYLPALDSSADLDADGFSAFHFWELMQVFGPKMHMTMTDMPFEGNEITFLDEPAPAFSM